MNLGGMMLYYVSGDDSFNKNKFINEKSAGKEQIIVDMSVVDYSSLMSNILSVDLFANPKIYIFENFKGFSNKSEKYSKANTALLKQIFGSNEEIIIISDKAINRKTSWFVAFGTGMEVSEYKLENLDYDTAIAKFICDHQITISKDALELLNINFPNNIFGATNDLKKIWEYTNHQPISEQDVKVAGQKIGEHKIFELYNLIVTGQKIKAINYLEIIRGEGITDSDILLVSFTQFKRMYETKILIAKGYNDFKIASQIGVNPYATKQNRKILNHVSLQRLESLICLVADFDYQFKSGKNTPTNLVNLLIVT